METGNRTVDRELNVCTAAAQKAHDANKLSKYSAHGGAELEVSIIAFVIALFVTAWERGPQ